MLKTKPWWLSIFTSGMWVTIYPHIYYPGPTEPHDDSAIIVHETKHLEQQQAMGLYKWLFKYFFSREFRLHQEVEAIVKEIMASPYQMTGSIVGFYATQLSSRAYLWAAPQWRAHEAILAALKKEGR